MKLWVVASICAIAVLIFLALSVSTSSISGTVSSPSVIDLGSSSPIGVDPSLFAGVFPTPIGIRRSAEQCYAGDSNPCRTAAQAAIADYLANIEQTPLAAPSLVYAEYVEWPDSCLGTFHEGQLCTQAITPGYRIYILVPGRTIARCPEYHTDLAGHTKLFPWGAPPDLPTPPLTLTLGPCPFTPDP